MEINNILDLQLFKIKDFTLDLNDLVLIITLFFVTYFVLWGIRKVLNKVIKSKHVDTGKSHALFQIIKYFIWISVILIALDTIGLNITVLVAGSTALFVGLGLGLQQTFQDIVSGIILLFEGTFLVGDVVQIEDEVVGKVLEIGLRTSKIETRDKIIMIVPNSTLMSDNVINWSHMEKRTRFSVKVGVSYGSDVELVKQILLECAQNNKDVLKKPVPFVRFQDFGDSSLNFEVYFWTNNSFWVENTKSDIRFAIWFAFKERGVQIPFPQRDLHIISQPSSK